LIQEEADEDANIIFGTVIDQNMEDEIRITVIATGFDDFNKKKTESLGNVTRFNGFGRREDLATPTFIRRERKLNSGEVAVVGLGVETENMDMQIPTFLRRQAD
jgi:cell division protein FtsZ